MVGMRGEMKSDDKDLQKGIAYALWACYEYSLPDVPGRMAICGYEIFKRIRIYTGGTK
jgi:hypothetical protein